MTGRATINLGDGNNVLDPVTSGAITLGGLTYTGGDGTDTVTVSGGADSRIGGTAKFTYANGGSETNLTGGSYTAVSVTATEGTGIPNTSPPMGSVCSRRCRRRPGAASRPSSTSPTAPSAGSG